MLENCAEVLSDLEGSLDDRWVRSLMPLVQKADEKACVVRTLITCTCTPHYDVMEASSLEVPPSGGRRQARRGGRTITLRCRAMASLTRSV